MRAICFEEYGDPSVLHLKEVPVPIPGPSEIRLAVAAIGVNPADGKWRQGMFRDAHPLSFPHIPGYDIAGTVEEIGADVKNFKIGDRAVAMLGKGGYAEYAVIPSAEAALIPHALDFAAAAALPTAGLTGFQLIEEHIRPLPGQRILITGAIGAVGRIALYAAIQRGAQVVAATRAAQADEAIKIGASEIVILGDSTWTGPPFDAIVDTVGGLAVEQLCHHLVPGGLIRTAATTPIVATSLVSQPVFVIVHNDPARLTAIAKLAAAGQLGVPIARRLPLSAAAEAQAATDQGGLGGKIILIP